MTEQTSNGEPSQSTVDPAESETATISNWEFLDRAPSAEEVVELLKTLPDVWGVRYVDYADYVQGLPSVRKVKVPKADNPKVKVEEHHDVVTIYMGVAGRLKMLQEAQERNGWRVDFEPEPTTPTGVPGYLRMEGRIVYREYVTIYEGQLDEQNDYRMLGRRPGTAWVPETGGTQAKGTNPYEKVETSARGRALAAWGFGVLPGSGIASLEEVLGARDNQRAMDVRDDVDARRGVPRKPRLELVSDAMTLAEEMRQHRGQDESDKLFKLADYAKTSFGVDIVVSVGDGGLVEAVDLQRLKDGQLQLLLNALEDSKRRWVAENQDV